MNSILGANGVPIPTVGEPQPGFVIMETPTGQKIVMQQVATMIISDMAADAIADRVIAKMMEKLGFEVKTEEEVV